MKRMMSLVLAAIMLLGFLPATAVPVAAADSAQIEANYTAAAITIDGQLDENQWILRDRIGAAEFTALCNQEKLFFGLRTTQSAAELNVNGVAVAVDFSAGTVLVNGDKVGSALHNVTKGSAEFELPLSAVGLSYGPNQQVDFALKLGGDTLAGTMLLANRAVVVSENMDNVAARTWSKSIGKDTNEVWAEQGEGGSIHFRTGTLSEKGGELNAPNWPIADLDKNQGYEVTFTADFNDLPVANQLGYLAICGFFVDIRSAEYCRHGFFADKDGNLMVSLYDEPADLTKQFDTGLDLPAKDVDVRIVVNDDFTSEVFINGKSVANFPKPTRKATGTSMIIGITTLRRDTTVENKSDVNLYDFLITQDAPLPQLTVSQVANSADLTMDGSADEMFWVLGENVGKTKLGALCDEQNLYLALESAESSVVFDLNGLKGTAKLGSKPSIAVGYTMGSTIKGNGKGQYEISVPLKLLQVDKPSGQQLPFSVTSGGDSRDYTMVVGGGAKLELITRDPVSGDGKNDAIAYLDVAQLTRDGKLKENQWYTPYQMAGGSGTTAAAVGFLWDSYNLYVGGQVFSTGKPQSMELTINGKTVTADMNAVTSSVGTLLIDGQTFEWCLPLKDLNMTAPLNTAATYELKMTNDKGSSFIHGKLDIVGKSVVWGDSCDDFLTKNYDVYSKTTHTQWGQGEGIYAITTDSALGSTNEIYEFYTPLDFEGGAYEFSVDMNIKDIGNYTSTFGWRGLCWEIRQPELQTRFNFRQDGNGNIIMDILYYLHYESMNTGVKLGERATYTVKVSADRIPSLYVNGEYVGSFSTLNREQFTINDTRPMPRLIIEAQNHGRALNADGSLSRTNVDIYDMLWTQEPYNSTEAVLDAALAQLKEEDILAGSDAADTLKLRLPKTITVSDIGTVLDVNWTAVDAVTGQKFSAIDLNTGAVTRGSRPVVFDLTAAVSFNGKGAAKTFTFQVQGKPSASKVAMIYYDQNPLVGQMTDWDNNRYDYFDTNQNSLVIDQGSSKKFNRIVLHDGDSISRVAQRHLGVFISEDGKAWTKVTGWLLHQDGKDYTLYNLNAKARYVKVHTYHDDYAVSEYQPSFYNIIPEMLSVSNEPCLPGANGAFAHKAEFVAKNATAAEQKDTPVFISIASLGAKAGQYKADGADFRFTIGNTTLAHWYNGTDGFYVRVPSVPAKGSTTITAHWGCGSAKDFSDGEAVFEVTYGNITVMPLYEQTGIFTHGRPIVLSNGDVIVVGRRSSTRGDLAFIRSTDGGYTFDKNPEVVILDADYKGRALGYGGHLYNPILDRLYLFAYSGSSANANDYRIVITYTDDCGYTWSDPVYLSGAHVEPVQSTDSIIQGYPNYFGRTVFYGDGVTLSTYDGDGPNVDYVFSSEDSDMRNNPPKLIAFVIYSCDDGKTWTMSPSVFDIPVDQSRNAEDGLSETTLTELSNGDLMLVVRTQQDGNFYLWQGISKDQGRTWEQKYSPIISSNTSPCFYRYDDTRLLMWSAMTGLGGVSYRRTPMHLAYTTDDFQSFDKVIDLTFGTSLDTIHEQESRMTQPGIAVYDGGNSAFVAYFDHMWKLRDTVTVPGVAGWRGNGTGTMGFKIDEFEDMLYGNKGAYDNFEVDKLKYQGWLCDLGHVIELSSEASVSGMYSMKVVDAQAVKPAHAVRQVPSMKSGTVGAKLMAPEANSADFVMELKAAYNYTHMQHTLAAFALSPDGTVSLCSDEGKTAVTKVEPGTWNDFAISFDIASGKGQLTVNGKAVRDITLETDETMYPLEGGKPVEYHQEDVVREITCVQFNQAEATADMGDCLYVDDFYATELTSALSRTVYNIDFADVKQGDWYFDAVNFAVENGIMSGYNTDKFGPNDTLNRAMVVQVLYNKEGQPALNGLKHSFSDVPASQWFNNAVTWGSNRGVVSGFGGGVFKPEDAVTIEQVAVILWNYSNTPAGYGDLSKVGNHSDWAANALRWCVDKGILSGVPFTNATEKATRAQTAQMLTNFLRAE